MHEYRVVLNQLGAAIELHNHGGEPVTLVTLPPSSIERWGRKMVAELGNPDMRYASIEQVALYAARQLVTQPYLVSPGVWTYNASTQEYARA
jgi:hypothetical protein